ncbi:hypothetical protein LINPERHAP1_LOCUS21532 [Linum perenne]
MPPCPYLIDLVGKVVAVGEPNHVERNSSVALVQKVTIIDASDIEVVVWLWSEFVVVLDAASIVLDDKINSFIVALDLVGKVVAVGEPNHVERNSSVALVQKVTIIDASDIEVVVWLWSEFVVVLDAASIVLDDKINSFIVALDLVGKVVAVGEPNHVERNSSVALVQKVTIIDASDIEVVVWLWSEFVVVLDAASIVLDDKINSFIVALDLVGKVVAVGEPNHVERNSSVALVQKVTIIDASDIEVVVWLWSEFVVVLDAASIVLDDKINSFIVALDLVGKVVAVGEPNHVERNSSVALVQKVTIIDASDIEVVVWLWSEFVVVLDAASIVLDDKINSFIVALDLVGKVVAVGEPNHVERNSSVALVQKVTIIDASDIEVVVWLWSEFVVVLDAASIVLDDKINSFIVALDLVGKVVAVGEPNHVERNSSVALVQKVTIIDASDIEVVVWLWSEFVVVLDAASIVLDDKINSFIVALGSFRFGTF